MNVNKHKTNSVCWETFNKSENTIWHNLRFRDIHNKSLLKSGNLFHNLNYVKVHMYVNIFEAIFFLHNTNGLPNINNILTSLTGGD